MKQRPGYLRYTLVGVFLLSLMGLSLIVFVQPAFSAFVPPNSNRQDLIINDSWKFFKGNPAGAQNLTFDDSSWTNLSLPHTWNNLDGQDGGNNYYRGPGWYRRHYTPANSLTGRNLYLQFDGANLVTDLYVNGIFIGQHKGGYATFRFDVTSQLIPGADNLIAVKVNNVYNNTVAPLSADYTFFGGIYRDVHLLVTDRLQVDTLDYGSSGVYLKTTNVSASSADLQVITKVRNTYTVAKNLTVNTTLVGPFNQTVQTLTTTQTINSSSAVTITQNTVVTNPYLWNGPAGAYLYKVYVEIKDGNTVVDLVTQTMGFRFFNIDANQGFFLNGQYLDLHGVNRHQDRPGQGWVITKAQQDEDMALLKELNVTAVRLAHYQHDQYFYDLTDRNGLVVWAEIPLVNSINPTQAFYDNATQQMTELIRQNYNHPSIMFWGIQNEVGSPAPNNSPLFNTLNNLIHTEDPTRLSTFANYKNDVPHPSDLVGVNYYGGWYHDTYDTFATWADATHQQYPNDKIAISEFGAGASLYFHSNSPVMQDHSEEYQNLYHEAYWKAMKVRPYLWGKFVWNLADFASDNRNEGDTPGRNDKGLVSYDRTEKKDAFYWYKANWSNETFVYITGQRYWNAPYLTRPLSRPI